MTTSPAGSPARTSPSKDCPTTRSARVTATGSAAPWPRSPSRATCYRAGLRLGEPRMPALLVSHRRPGFHLRVLRRAGMSSSHKPPNPGRAPPRPAPAAPAAGPGDQLRALKPGPLSSRPAAVRAPSSPSSPAPAICGCPARRWGAVGHAAAAGRAAVMTRPGHPDAMPNIRAAWRRASSAASARLITKVPGWPAVQRRAAAGPVKCST